MGSPQDRAKISREKEEKYVPVMRTYPLWSLNDQAVVEATNA